MPEALWILDDGALRRMSERLVEKFEDKIGHVDLDKIMLARVQGSRSNWAGKCYSVRAPWHLLTMAPALFGAEMDAPHDIRYIIILNDDLVRGIFIHREKEAMVLLHELLHVKRDMEGVAPHDVEDFHWMLHQFGIDWQTNDVEELRDQFSSIVEEPPDGTE